MMKVLRLSAERGRECCRPALNTHLPSAASRVILTKDAFVRHQMKTELTHRPK
jgi:hypothetical protein